MQMGLFFQTTAALITIDTVQGILEDPMRKKKDSGQIIKTLDTGAWAFLVYFS